MLQLYYGTDQSAVRAAAFAAARDASDSYRTLTAEEIAAGALGEAAEAASLFGGSAIYVVDPGETPEAQEAVIALLDTLAASLHTFVLIMGSLTAAAAKPFRKAATVAEEYKAAAKEHFNTFALTDALAARNKKQLWLLFTEARLAGLSPEELAGVLWWQVKSMLLASQTSSAAEAGMKDYPYRKAKAALQHYSKPELEALAHDLLTIYHEGHSGECEFDLALEQWALRL